MSVYLATGRKQISFSAVNVAGRITFTFVSTTGALNPPLSTGVALTRIERDCTIYRATLITVGGTGSCVLDIWKAAYGSFPPTVANSITASAKPTIAGGIKYEDTTLTGWSRSLSVGDVLAANLDSSSTFKKIVLVLETR